jgi:hypothetical protein
LGVWSSVSQWPQNSACARVPPVPPFLPIFRVIMRDAMTDVSSHSSRSSSSKGEEKPRMNFNFNFNLLVWFALVLAVVVAVVVAWCSSTCFVGLCRDTLQRSETAHSTVKDTTGIARLSESQTAKEAPHTNPLLFCRVPQVTNLQHDANSNPTPFIIQHQRAGTPHKEFSKKLLDFAAVVGRDSSLACASLVGRWPSSLWQRQATSDAASI